MIEHIDLLLVEDNPNDEILIMREIKRAGVFDVYYKVASNMTTFLDLLCRQSWDVIICDHHLLGVTSTDIIRVLEDHQSHIPIIVTSGSMTSQEKSIVRQSFLNKDDMSRVVPIIQKELNQTKSFFQVLLSWGKAIELKDHHTAGHTARVTAMSIELAERMNLCWTDICHLKLGAYLHDVGKIMVRDEVLQKPGPLTKDEKKEMQRHTLYAAEMLRPMKLLNRAIDVPLYHHERWDGTGYPYGLKGTKIPLLARIFSVVDNYDAMTTDRPYRAALSMEFTLTYIYENSRKMFDPSVVRAFVEMMKESS